MTLSVHLFDLDSKRFDHRIRQQLVGGWRINVELEVLALTDVADAGVAHRMQRFGDGASLRIEYGWLQGDEHSGFHTVAGTFEKTRSKMASTLRKCSSRSNALSTSAGVSTRVKSASCSSSALKSRCSSNARMAFRWTHS